jgi:uncharacterized protein YqgC (DUF456 family)
MMTDYTGNGPVLNWVLDKLKKVGIAIVGVAKSAWDGIVDFFSKPAVQKTLMIIGSVLEIVGGSVLIAFGILKPGATLIAMGTGSLINGFMNESSGGSFLAGWAGGQVSGLATSIPYVGAIIGAFISSIITDAIDTKGERIDLRKAGVSALVAWLFDAVPIGLTQYMGTELKTRAVQFALSYRGALIGLINGIFNLLFGRKRNES